MPDPYVHVSSGVFDAVAAGAPAGLEPDDDHHVRRVLRLSAGDGLVVSDGRGRELAVRLTADGLQSAGEVVHRPAPTPRIHLLQGLAKARKVDEVIRAVTELGVNAVSVVAAERSVVQLRGPKEVKVRDRWRSVARSAAGQSRRAYLPDIDGPVDVATLASSARGGVVGVVAHVGAGDGLRTVLEGAVPDSEVRLAVGPEGGWTDAEVERFVGAGYRVASLGDSVLRTEHAGLVAAAVAATVLGWMG